MKRKTKRKVKRYDIRRAHEDYLLRRYTEELRHFARLAWSAFRAAKRSGSIGRMAHRLRIAQDFEARVRRAREILRGVERRARRS